MNREEILNELKRYKPVLEKKYGITKLGLFGSVARGDMRDSSDVDVVIEVENVIGPFILLDIKEELNNLLGCKVDLIRMRKNLNKILKMRIKSEYPQVEWNKAKKMRDVIAHHYFDIDEEVVFVVCQKHLPLMLEFLEE